MVLGFGNLRRVLDYIHNIKSRQEVAVALERVQRLLDTEHGCGMCKEEGKEYIELGVDYFRG